MYMYMKIHSYYALETIMVTKNGVVSFCTIHLYTNKPRVLILVVIVTFSALALLVPIQILKMFKKQKCPDEQQLHMKNRRN